VRWYWGGCTTFLGVLEDGATKELLLLDGYVSKDASGLVDFTVSTAGIARVVRYADFIKGFLDQGFKIRGLVTTHSHADHVGDIPLLLYYLKQSARFEAFPIVTDYSTKQDACKPNNLGSFFNAAEQAKILSFKELVTDILVYKTGPMLPAASVVTDCLGTALSKAERTAKEGEISIHKKGFSREYSLYNVATGSYTAANTLTFGRFGITAFLMDHAGIPTVSEDYRVNAYQVWDTASPGEGKVLVMDTTDQDAFVTSTIETDHLFLTWTPELFQSWDDALLGNNRARTATTVRNQVRFSTGTTNYVVPMHVDDIMATSYTTEDIANAALKTRGTYDKDGTTMTRYEPVYYYSVPSFMMSPATHATRLPENSEYSQGSSSAHVDFLVPGTALWSTSPATYSTTKQKDATLAFALFKWRMGD
jgi:hypothetical protein